MNSNPLTNNLTISAVIFDMDGLLINSEPLWDMAMLDLFSTLGLEIGEKDFLQVQGMRIDLIVDSWYEKRPWPGPSPQQTTGLILDRVTNLIEQQGQTMEGAHEAIHFFRQRDIPLGVASSSPQRIINTCISVLSAEGSFDVVCSA